MSGFSDELQVHLRGFSCGVKSIHQNPCFYALESFSPDCHLRTWGRCSNSYNDISAFVGPTKRLSGYFAEYRVLIFNCGFNPERKE
jgi:hypothetical protein